jgi:hypothetical protein
MYLPDTFGGDFNNPCQIINTRDDYLKVLKDNGIKCSGSWCDSKGGFSCKEGPYNCYNMEHIVDLKNSMFDDYGDQPKMILGNLIMAYGKWNIEMGPLKWENVEREKRNVYGDNVVDQAIDNIQKCYDREHGTTNAFAIIGIVFVVLLIVVGVGIIGYIMHRIFTKNRSREDNQYVEMGVLEKQDEPLDVGDETV